MAQDSKGVANRVQCLRFTLKLTQEAFAARAGLQRSNLSTIEHGRGDRSLKLSHLANLAEATGVNLQWLVTGHGPMFARDLLAGTPESSELGDLINALGDESTVTWLRAILDLPATTRSVLLRTVQNHVQPSAEAARAVRRASKRTQPRPGSDSPA